MKKSARIWLAAILLLLVLAMVACTGGGGGTAGAATAAARATEQYGAEQFHLQLTAQAKESGE